MAKHLGKGLVEFRIRRDESVIRGQGGPIECWQAKRGAAATPHRTWRLSGPTFAVIGQRRLCCPPNHRHYR
jgi:hypothetical protein